MTRLKDGPGEENNPIVQYQEWAEHRYNPGRWLGGNVPPSTRNLWSGINPRWLGTVYVGGSIVGGWLAFRGARNSADLVYALLALSVYFIPGVIMLVARGRKRRRRSQIPEDARPVTSHNHPHHHGHGRYSDH
jgi:hypothetical protein